MALLLQRELLLGVAHVRLEHLRLRAQNSGLGHVSPLALLQQGPMLLLTLFLLSILLSMLLRQMLLLLLLLGMQMWLLLLLLLLLLQRVVPRTELRQGLLQRAFFAREFKFFPCKLGPQQLQLLLALVQ